MIVLRGFEFGPCVGQHVTVDVDTDGAAGTRRKQFEHPSRTGAKIDKTLERSGTESIKHLGLDLIFSQMEAAHHIPLTGMFLEIGLRGFGSLMHH